MRVAQVVGTRNISQLKKNPKVYEPSDWGAKQFTSQSLRFPWKGSQTVYAYSVGYAKQFTDFTALK